MSVDGVNRINNTGLYTSIGAVAGAGAGVAAGYLTRPFLKNGAPTDSFLKKIEANCVKAMDSDKKQQYELGKKYIKDLKNAKNPEELRNALHNLDSTDVLDDLVDEIDEIINQQNIDTVKKHIFKELELDDELYNEFKLMFEASWDANKKKFVHNADEMPLQGFNIVKNAARSIQGKYAAIYGSIGAAVLGLGTYLCTKGKGSNSAMKAANTTEQKPQGKV